VPVKQISLLPRLPYRRRGLTVLVHDFQETRRCWC